MDNKVTLGKHLTIAHAVALAIGMVVGAGYLVVPGIIYHQSGIYSLSAWILTGLAVIPLLMIFAEVGASYPSSEGLSGYFGVAFGKHACHAMQILVLTTFILAMPAIAIVGGKYAGYIFGLSKTCEFVIASLFFISTCVFNTKGIVVSSRVQNALSFFLFIALFLIASLSLIYGNHSIHAISGLLEFHPGILKDGDTLGIVFFAFIGWEMLSFISGEFENPKKDFPLALIISFFLVMLLYIGVALAIALNLPVNDSYLLTSPISQLLSVIFGSDYAICLAILAIVIVLANVNGATLAISRLIYSSAKSGLFPYRLATLEEKTTSPNNAIMMVTALFLIILFVCYMGLIDQSTLLRLSGKTFFIIYMLIAIAHIKLSKNRHAKILGIGVTLICILIISSYGLEILFSAVILGLGLIWSSIQCKS